MIPLRLTPRSGADDPPVLRPLDPATGWWVDHRSWDHVIARVAPFTTPRSDNGDGRYGWVPDEGIARIYQAAASRQRVIRLEFAPSDSDRSSGGNLSGVHLSSGGSVLASHGDEIRVRLVPGEMVWGLGTVEFFDRAERLGAIDFGSTPEFSFTVDGNRRVYSLHARTTHRGVPRTSNPLQVVVRDSEISEAIDHQLRATGFARSRNRRALGPEAYVRIAGATESDRPRHDDTVPARFLTRTQEASLCEDGELSPVWSDTMEAHGIVRLDSRLAIGQARGGSMDVSAAHGEEGLYFLFRVVDPDWGKVAADTFTGMIDFHLASIGLEALEQAPVGPSTYAYARAYSLLRNAVQMQIPTTGEPSDDQAFFANYWDPWDPVRFSTSRSEAYAGTGLWIDRVDPPGGGRVFEVFLPWSLVGNPGFQSRPPVGSSLATVISYSTLDPDGKMNWPHGRNPWHEPAIDPETNQPVAAKTYGASCHP